MKYSYRRGSTLVISLDAAEGDTSAIISIAARICRLPEGRQFLRSEDLVNAAPMVVTDRAVNGAIPAGWDFTLPASETIDLKPGNYLVDAIIEVAGGVEITSTSARVEITQGAVQ